jgi:hypothetical protein
MNLSPSDLEAARRALRDLCDAPKPVSRSVFSAWSPERQSLFCRAGGKILDDPKPPRRMVPLGQSHAPATAFDLRAAHAADIKLAAQYRAQLR